MIQIKQRTSESTERGSKLRIYNFFDFYLRSTGDRQFELDLHFQGYLKVITYLGLGFKVNVKDTPQPNIVRFLCHSQQ